MPFRRWFAEHDASHPVAYSILTLVVGVIAAMTISVVISVQASNRAIAQNIAQERQAQLERERLARELEVAQAERARLALCFVVQTQQNVYVEAAPSTPAGVKAREAWDYVALIFNCKKG